jgi:PKD repeat protein
MADWYVATDGSDAGSGTSTSPFKTIQKGVDAASAGDTVHVSAGSYNETVSVSINGKRDTGNLTTTIQRKSGETDDVIIDGQGTSPSNIYNALLHITGKYITVDYINVANSGGRGILISGSPDTVTVSNSYVTNCLMQCINIYGENRDNSSTNNRPQNITIDTVVTSYSGMRYANGDANDWPGCISVRAADDVTINDCTVHSTWGEGVMADSNRGNSTGVTIEDNVFYDNFAPSIHIHATSDLVCQRNLVYRSSTDKARSNPFMDKGRAIVCGAIENHYAEDIGCDDIKIVSNIVAGCDVNPGLVFPARDNAITDLLVANNTITNCDTGIKAEAYVGSSWVFKNNIITGCDTKVSAGSKDDKWTYDYNGWDVAPSKFSGTNDTIGATSDLEDYDFNPAAGEHDATYFNHASGGSWIDAGDDLSADYATAPAADATDYFNAARGGTWDLGAHEDGGATRPSISNTPTPDPATIEEGETVDFNSTVVGGTAAYTYAWTFPGGSPPTSTSADPSNILYATAGVYTAKCIVTDANGLTDEVEETVTVQAASTGTTASVTVEQVVFNAGAASYVVSAAPKAIVFMWSGGISDATAVNESEIGFGIYDVGNDQGYGMSLFADHNVATSNTSVSINTSNPIYQVGVNETEAWKASVSSVTASAVSLSWTGTTASEKVISWNFYGSGVTNVLATALSLGNIASETTTSGDYNLMFMPFVGRAPNSIYGNIDCSFGFAERDGEQMCLAYGQSDGKGTTETFGKLWTNRVGGYARTPAACVEISTWTSGTLGLTPRGRNINTTVPMLIMNISSDADIYIAVEDSPTGTGNNDYTDASFDAQVFMALLSNLTAMDTQSTGSAVFGALSVDSGGTDRTVMVSSKDNVGTTVEKSYTDSDYAIIDEDGTMESEGPASIITNGFRLAPTTAGSTAYKMLTLLIEDVSTGSGPTADFTWSPKPQAYDSVVNFFDLSSDDGVNAITGWDWDWGDGTAHGSTQNPTHTFTAAGDYEVILEVTDAGAATDTKTYTVTITVPVLTVSFTATPTSGEIPHVVTLDASASTAGGDEILDEDATQWEIVPAGEFGYPGSEVPGRDDNVGEYYASDILASGITTSVTLDQPGSWDIKCTIVQASTGETKSLIKYGAVETSQELLPDFYGQHGQIVVTGPYTAEFTAELNIYYDTGPYLEWHSDDGYSSTGYDQDNPISHTFLKQRYLTFNGTTSEINCGSDSALDDLHDDAMTVEAWIKADGLGEASIGRVVHKGQWDMFITSAGLYAAIACATTNGQSYTGSGAFSADSEWHHVAFTWDDASYNYPRIWIDGAEQTNNTQNRSGAVISDGADDLIIGNIGDGSRTWDGDIAWVRVSDSVLYTATFTPPARDVPPETATTTVEQWNLNDGTGTTAAAEEDSTTNDGTITDGTWGTFDFQSYLDFNGTTSGIDCGSDSTLDDLHDEAFTVEAWINADGYGENNEGRIADKGPVGTDCWYFFVDSVGGLAANIGCVTTYGTTRSGLANLSLDEWHHVAMTWDDATYTYPRLWIDGKEYSTTTQDRVGAVNSDAASALHIGNRVADNRAFDGSIAWVRISDSILYTDTFNPPSLYSPPRITSTTLEQWNFNEGSHTIARSEVETPTNDGTITAGTWTTLSDVYAFDITLDAWLLENTTITGPPDGTITKRDYITIVDAPEAPLNVSELTAIAAEIKKHIGCLADATWVQEGAPNTSVYTATVSRKWAAGYTYTVKEDAQDLTSQASIAACQASAGSFYVNYSDPNLEVSVHATGSDDPTTNGSTYSLRFT